MTREKKLQGTKKDLIKIKAACSALIDYGAGLRHIINLSREVYCSTDEMHDTMIILQLLRAAASRQETAEALVEKSVSQETAKTPFGKYRYYLTERPLQPGAFPNATDNKPVTVCEFDRKAYDAEFGSDTYGYLEYEQPLTPDQIYQYELTACGK